MKTKKDNIAVIGCGRFGTFIAAYLCMLAHRVTLCGRPGSKNMTRLMAERVNEYMRIPDALTLAEDYACLAGADIIVISIASQQLRSLMRELAPMGLKNKLFVLCMKGIENGTGCRLSQIVHQEADASNRTAVWIGPGHVEDFVAGIPNCMVIDSDDEAAKRRVIDDFSGGIIRFYYGVDLIGNEVGAAAKNVMGIAAGMLDALGASPLKGALMSRGTREVSRLIKAMGGNELSAYGLCHLGDYQATLFSPHSHNRRFGEAFVRKESYAGLAEGYYTVRSLETLAGRFGEEMPISSAVGAILHRQADAKETMTELFMRSQKQEF